jgi:hypothetical protein
MQNNTMMIRHQKWMWAIRQEMGWPLFKPANDSLAFSSGRALDVEVGMELGRLATEMRKDIIYSSWANVHAEEPSGYTIVVRELLKTDVIDRCLPWAASESGPIIFISTRGDEMFAIGRRGLLERVAGKPKARAKGRALAMKRIRAAAAAMGDELASGNVHLPFGSPWVEPDQPAETVVQFG